MASNSFGNLFRITTWGESHGKAMGVVIDGCPAGVNLTEQDINHELRFRAPGQNNYTSPRQEKDQAEIYSGIFEGKTTGTPISIIIMNKDANTSAYQPIKQLLRPGHANFTYLNKYGHYDYRGGGRASARETVCRVAAGAVAKKILENYSIQTCAYLAAVAEIQVNNTNESDLISLKKTIYANPIFCPDQTISEKIMEKISAAKANGDSLGGIVKFIISNLPIGLGDPIYEKLEANLAKAMLSLPATKAFEIGEGFHAAEMKGSTHNDLFGLKDGAILPETNHAGGLLGGISTGQPITGRVAFKPPSSIAKPQKTIDIDGNPDILKLPEGSRHDPCVAIRAVPIVEAMCALVIVDALLMHRSAVLS